jgi:hypothetical protein
MCFVELLSACARFDSFYSFQAFNTRYSFKDERLILTMAENAAAKAASKKRVAAAAVVYKLTKTHKDMSVHQAARMAGFATPEASKEALQQQIRRGAQKLQAEEDAINNARRLHEIEDAQRKDRVLVEYSPSKTARARAEKQIMLKQKINKSGMRQNTRQAFAEKKAAKLKVEEHNKYFKMACV